jgi:hypothetical protein
LTALTKHRNVQILSHERVLQNLTVDGRNGELHGFIPGKAIFELQSGRFSDDMVELYKTRDDEESDESVAYVP